ncbi:MAG TPA: S8 family serine peptidase [Methanocorpusculum sp.]|nr:S8 family serine peptidase [Methanocorpusculum sp.]
MKKKLTSYGLLIIAAVLLITCVAVPVQAASLPNDPLFCQTIPGTAGQPSMWHLLNTDGGISAQDAWNIPENESIIVAVLDSGVDQHHPDLEGNLWVNNGEIPGNLIDDDQNGYVDDINGWNFPMGTNDVYDQNGHGTNCAGLIAAVTNNNEGMAGVGRKVIIMPIVISDAAGSSGMMQTCLAIRYAVDNGAKIISYSNGGDPGDIPSKEVIDNFTAALQYAEEKGVLFVAAAGNEKNDNEEKVVFPAELNHKYANGTNKYGVNNMLVVGATNYTGKFASSFSNYGPFVVDLGAPGERIVTTSVILAGIRQPSINVSTRGNLTAIGADWGGGVHSQYGAYLNISGNNRSILGTNATSQAAGEGTGNDYVLFTTDIYAKNASLTFYASRYPVEYYWNTYGQYAIDNFTKDIGTNITVITKEVINTDVSLTYEELNKKIGTRAYYLAVEYNGTGADSYFELYNYGSMTDIYIKNHVYSEKGINGTSFSTPIVAGAAAYILSVHPELTPADLKYAIMESVDLDTTEFGSRFYSFGSLNLSRALTYSQPCQVIFNSTGGSDVPSQIVLYEQKVTKPEDPVKAGYTFVNWCNDSTLQTAWNFTADKVFGPTMIYANWTLNTSSTTVEPDGTATFGENNITSLDSAAEGIVDCILLENVGNLTVGTRVNFTADNTTLDYIPKVDGRSTIVLAIFDLDATINESATNARFNVTLTFNDTAKATENMQNLRIWHYNVTEGSWDNTSLVWDKVQDEETVTYTVYTTAFSPFGIGLYPVIPPEEPVYRPSSGHSGATVILPETAEPTVVPTTEPTLASTTVPIVGPTTQPTQQSPAPFVGVLAGLGVATVLLRLRK